MKDIHRKTAQRVVDIASEFGYVVTFCEGFNIWRGVSDRYNVYWLGEPKSDDDVWELVYKYIVYEKNHN